MKITIKELWQSQEGLSTLMNTKFANAKSSYWVSKIVKKVLAEFESINKFRNDTAKSIGIEDVKKTSDIQEAAFRSAWEDFEKGELDLDIQKLKFEHVSEVKFSPKELAPLDWLIEEPVEK
jgi:hypothetical protein